jgi:hypothetical protein
MNQSLEATSNGALHRVGISKRNVAYLQKEADLMLRERKSSININSYVRMICASTAYVCRYDGEGRIAPYNALELRHALKAQKIQREARPAICNVAHTPLCL